MASRVAWLSVIWLSGWLAGCSSDKEEDDGVDAGEDSRAGGAPSTERPIAGGRTPGAAQTNGGSEAGAGKQAASGAQAVGGASSGAGNAQGGATTAVTLDQQRTGEGTYYGADGSGACMFDPSPEAMDVAALNQPDWAGSAWCGACADVTGPIGKIRIRIVDLCPECKPGDLDFSLQAFEKIAVKSAGRVPISWNFVACDVTGPVRYRYKDGANQWWTAVQVQNSRLPVTKLEFSKDGAGFATTERQDYNYFLAEGGFGSGAVRVRITAVDGQTLEDELPPVQELLTMDGQAQFK